VELTLAEYELLRERGEPVLAPAHALPGVERARARARTLAEEAAALQAQAALQLRRARRNLSRAVARTPARRPKAGQPVWIDGREARFQYRCGPAAAVIRYCDEPGARVVAYGKIALDAPER
jgi:hypothetical protein